MSETSPVPPGAEGDAMAASEGTAAGKKRAPAVPRAADSSLSARIEAFMLDSTPPERPEPEDSTEDYFRSALPEPEELSGLDDFFERAETKSGRWMTTESDGSDSGAVTAVSDAFASEPRAAATANVDGRGTPEAAATVDRGAEHPATDTTWEPPERNENDHPTWSRLPSDVVAVVSRREALANARERLEAVAEETRRWRDARIARAASETGSRAAVPDTEDSALQPDAGATLEREPVVEALVARDADTVEAVHAVDEAALLRAVDTTEVPTAAATLDLEQAVPAPLDAPIDPRRPFAHLTGVVGDRFTGPGSEEGQADTIPPAAEEESPWEVGASAMRSDTPSASETVDRVMVSDDADRLPFAGILRRPSRRVLAKDE